MTPERDKTGKKSRLLLAAGLSFLVAVAAGANAIVAEKNPLGASLQDFGQWLSGVAGALAFIWLIVSYFQQGEELELQREELALTRAEMAKLAQQTERQAEVASEQQKIVANTELHQRRDTFGRIAEMMLPELAAICAQFLAPYRGAEAMAHLWQQVGAGDRLFPIQELARSAGRGADQFRFEYIDRLDGMETAGPKLNRYCEVYEQLIQGADKADPDGDLLRYYERSGLRAVYRVFCLILGRPEIQNPRSAGIVAPSLN